MNLTIERICRQIVRMVRILLFLLLACRAGAWTAIWGPVPGATSYRVYASNSVAGFAVVASTSGNLATNATVQPSTNAPTIYYATALIGTSAEGDPSPFYLFPAAPTVPKNVVVSTNSALPTFFSFKFPSSCAASASPALAVGIWYAWAHVLALDANRDSFFFAVDGLEDISGNEAALSPNWQWLRINGGNGGPSRVFALSAGPHSLVVRCREGALLDEVQMAQDPNYIPK